MHVTGSIVSYLLTIFFGYYTRNISFKTKCELTEGGKKHVITHSVQTLRVNTCFAMMSFEIAPAAGRSILRLKSTVYRPPCRPVVRKIEGSRNVDFTKHMETNREKLIVVIITRGPMIIFVFSAEKNKLVRRLPLFQVLSVFRGAGRRETGNKVEIRQEI